MKELLNEEIIAIYTNDERTLLCFIDIHGETWAYTTRSECCSETWFEEIINPENMVWEHIIGIEIKSMVEKESLSPEDDDNPRRGYIKEYGYTFKTQKGYTDIIYRNSSNGYYGGECEYLPDLTFKEGTGGEITSSIRNKRTLTIEHKKLSKPTVLTPWKDK